MNVLDIIILLLFIPAIIRGISKGLIEQVAAFASLVVSSYLAYLFSDKLGAFLSQWINVGPQLLYILSFAIIIVLVVVLLQLISKLATKFIKMLAMGWINSVLGFIFAIFNAAVIIGIVLRFVLSFCNGFLHMPGTWADESLIYQHFIKPVTDFIFPFFESLFSSISSGDGAAKMC
ncbi:MAG: CvpA family protein [Candidatus Cryptobacteroides sp.]